MPAERDYVAQLMDEEDEEADNGDEKPIAVKHRLNAVTINFFIVVIYLGVGGLIIGAIELPFEKERIAGNWDTISQVKLSNNTPQESALTSESDEAVRVRAMLAEAGCSFSNPSKPIDYDFDFTGSVFFALTCVTTIGYGTYVPTSFGGRLFTAVYSLLGISLILNFMFQVSHLWVMICKGLMQRFLKVPIPSGPVVLTDVTFESVNTSDSGEVDAKELRVVLQKLSRSDCSLDESIIAYCMWKADRTRTGRLDRNGLLNAISVFLQIWPTIPQGVSLQVQAVATLAITFWIFLWCTGIGAQEDWAFDESMWFGFVTLTTIGFGDKAPETHIGRVMSFLFIFIGLGMVTWFLTSLFEVWNKFTFWRAQRGYESGQLSDKYMDIKGYQFKSPLGQPRRWRLGPIVASQAPRKATLSVAYQELISSERSNQTGDEKSQAADSPPSSPKGGKPPTKKKSSSAASKEVMSPAVTSPVSPAKDRNVRKGSVASITSRTASPTTRTAPPSKRKKSVGDNGTEMTGVSPSPDDDEDDSC
ncbi:TWiK family of potassium channels protein 18 [Diplonema papillatum]|nr:TWiK family of potassium channels protein 18 [Diplonema papillatum]